MYRARFAFLVAFVLFLLASPAAVAAGNSPFSVSLWTGVGGSLDQDGPGLSNSSFQLGFAVQPEDQLLVGLRVGELDLGGGLVGDSVDTSLDYATVVGEYRFTESFYESGLYFGLGFYQLDGVVLLGDAFSEESVGLVVGISGEFVITKDVGFLLELSGHLTNLDTVDTVAMGHAGIAIHF